MKLTVFYFCGNDVAAQEQEHRKDTGNRHQFEDNP